MRQKLTDSVSVQELLYMREHEHLSNAQIAARLEVSVAVVYKYIGSCGRKQRNRSVISIGVVSNKLAETVGHPCTYLSCKDVLGKCAYPVCSANRAADCWRRVVQSWVK